MNISCISFDAEIVLQPTNQLENSHTENGLMVQKKLSYQAYIIGEEGHLWHFFA